MRLRAFAVLLTALPACAAAAAAPPAAPAKPAAAAVAAATPVVPAAGAARTQGYLYGTVETRGGQSYTGILRWGDEEAFWDDLYNAGKRDRSYERLAGADHRRHSRHFEFFGIPVSVGVHGDESRQLILRFGDLDQLRRNGRDEVVAVLKGGREIPLTNDSNDQDDAIVVRDATLGTVEIEQNRITRIVFRATPSDVAPPPARLWGRVETAHGEFEGFVQWDSQECLATDKLDGDTEDGRVSIEMGKIRAIARESRRAARIELADGRTLVLRGTNDVNEEIRGIMVETERFGRVKVSWNELERVDFADGHGSGKPYTAYGPARLLAAAVVSTEGKTERGRLIFDLDEETDVESLNGNQDDVEYFIPFALVRSIERLGADAAKVVLRNGAELRLEDETDVDDSNAGLAILGSGNAERYLPWDEVQRIDFD